MPPGSTISLGTLISATAVLGAGSSHLLFLLRVGCSVASAGTAATESQAQTRPEAGYAILAQKNDSIISCRFFILQGISSQFPSNIHLIPFIGIDVNGIFNVFPCRDSSAARDPSIPRLRQELKSARTCLSESPVLA